MASYLRLCALVVVFGLGLSQAPAPLVGRVWGAEARAVLVTLSAIGAPAAGPPVTWRPAVER